MDVGMINQWLVQYLVYIFGCSLIVSLVSLAYLFKTHLRLRRYKYLIKDQSAHNWEEIITGLTEKSHQNSQRIAALEEEAVTDRVKATKHIQNWGLVRYQAFQNTGGDQSFSLALLDANGDGIVTSSLFGREESRVYCKSVEAGGSEYPLSDEEKEAIQIALGKIRSKN